MADTTPRLTPPLTIEEVLEMEEASGTKHEFVAGQVYALAGGSRRHNRIAGNIFARLWTAAVGGPCAVYGSDMRLLIGDTAFYYPDVQVVCDPSDDEERYTTRPCVIVEVLSPSTESIDLREKWLLYSGLDSLQAYLIVYRDQMRVISHYRANGTRWYDALYFRKDAVPFPCPETEIAMADIYGGVELPNG